MRAIETRVREVQGGLNIRSMAVDVVSGRRAEDTEPPAGGGGHASCSTHVRGFV